MITELEVSVLQTPDRRMGSEITSRARLEEGGKRGLLLHKLLVIRDILLCTPATLGKVRTQPGIATFLNF